MIHLTLVVDMYMLFLYYKLCYVAELCKCKTRSIMNTHGDSKRWLCYRVTFIIKVERVIIFFRKKNKKTTEAKKSQLSEYEKMAGLKIDKD